MIRVSWSAAPEIVDGLVILLRPARGTGQSAASKSAANAPKSIWSPRRTPDGQPDLQGAWTNASKVPLQRSENLGAKEFYTEKEALENAQQGARADRPEYSDVQCDLSQYGLATGQQRLAASLRTSIISGPQGRIPPLTADARRRPAEMVESAKDHEYDGPENRPLQERYILAPDVGLSMLPAGYNSNLQIAQGPGYVAILQKMIHDVRVIPLDGRPHLPPGVRQWRGDPGGHWEGDTLVVDKTNFSDRTPFRSRAVAGLDRHFGFRVVNLHVLERFICKDECTILHEFTAEDWATRVSPWSGELTEARITSPIFEYACQEADILSGVRVQEQQAEALPVNVTR
jgi:hypothetical protein